MATKSKSAKGLPKRTGKRAAKYARYYAGENDRKLRRILKRNGVKAASDWADAHGAAPEFYRLTR